MEVAEISKKLGIEDVNTETMGKDELEERGSCCYCFSSDLNICKISTKLSDAISHFQYIEKVICHNDEGRIT